MASPSLAEASPLEKYIDGFDTFQQQRRALKRRNSRKESSNSISYDALSDSSTSPKRLKIKTETDADFSVNKEYFLADECNLNTSNSLENDAYMSATNEIPYPNIKEERNEVIYDPIPDEIHGVYFAADHSVILTDAPIPSCELAPSNQVDTCFSVNEVIPDTELGTKQEINYFEVDDSINSNQYLMHTKEPQHQSNWHNAGRLVNAGVFLDSIDSKKESRLKIRGEEVMNSDPHPLNINQPVVKFSSDGPEPGELLGEEVDCEPNIRVYYQPSKTEKF
jgi:hypothetical protein